MAIIGGRIRNDAAFAAIEKARRNSEFTTLKFSAGSSFIHLDDGAQLKVVDYCSGNPRGLHVLVLGLAELGSESRVPEQVATVDYFLLNECVNDGKTGGTVRYAFEVLSAMSYDNNGLVLCRTGVREEYTQLIC
jgi:hypothetical protein